MCKLMQVSRSDLFRFPYDEGTILGAFSNHISDYNEYSPCFLTENTTRQQKFALVRIATFYTIFGNEVSLVF